jgi:hypothetical protein
MLSQARTAGMGGFLGFDYASLPVVFAAKDIPQWEWIFYLEKLNAVQAIAFEYFNPKPELKKAPE